MFSTLGVVVRLEDTEALAALRALGISAEDVDLVFDRVAGGLVRGATMNPANEPSSEKDPLAWESYHRYVKARRLVVDAT